MGDDDVIRGAAGRRVQGEDQGDADGQAGELGGDEAGQGSAGHRTGFAHAP
ncbi:hypothetical protein KZZ52_23020 [Dactylosporangium sp. AC04546]|uniref:hypothetical protein n=1 Tax=Dactylosporangium sp. AC04546 TaxID=2862460 RepID=UPI001EDCD3C9|nr:hypothetical protein [Dactylosporangium sp. AC04546]WVK88150.1 hypothetical protein KZZ52_23020 [Dactylosporangium sp. AC04546]